MLQGAGVGTAPVFSTTTWPATSTVSQILYSSATNTVSGLATDIDGVLITSHTGVPSILANGTAGWVLTANSGAPPSWAAGGAGAVTWTDQGSSITLAVNTNYFVTAATTQTLPSSPSQGDTIVVDCDTTGAVVVTASSGKFIRIGSNVSAAAGTATSTAIGDSLTLTYRASNTTWHARGVQGNWTLV